MHCNLLHVPTTNNGSGLDSGQFIRHLVGFTAFTKGLEYYLGTLIERTVSTVENFSVCLVLERDHKIAFDHEFKHSTLPSLRPGFDDREAPKETFFDHISGTDNLL